MYSLNLITLMYYCYSLLTTMLGIYVNCNFFSNDIVSHFFKFGKLSSKKVPVFSVSKYAEVPKRWFVHFYYTSFLLSVASWILVFRVNLGGYELPESINSLFNFLTTSEREVAVNGTISLVALLLFTIHVWKRLYESLFISVFSSSKMSVAHYIVGQTHYIGAFVGLISLFPGLALKDIPENNLQFSGSISLWNYITVIFIICASYMQHHSFKILASLRRKDNLKSKEKHFMPSGGLFNFVSCPHFFTEILVYFGIAALMSFKHSTWNVVFLFVVCNQIQVALMNHKWYKQQFKDYPLKRKAIFPLLL